MASKVPTKATTTVKPVAPKAAPVETVKAAPVVTAPAAVAASNEKAAVAAPVEKAVVAAPAEKAPVTAPVEKTVVAQAEKLVAKIVSVDTKPITQGVEKMTETAKAKATDFFADIRERATEAAEKGKKIAAVSVEYNKANLEAMVEAGKIAAKGAQDLGKTNLEYAKTNFAEAQAAVKEITSVKNPTDFVKLQGELARKSFDTAVAQGSKNIEATVKLVSDMFQPISNRFAVTTDLFKKAA